MNKTILEKPTLTRQKNYMNKMENWNKKFKEINVKNTKNKLLFTQLKPISCCVVGSRDSGKTYFVKWLIEQFGCAMIIFNGTYIKLPGKTVDSYSKYQAVKIEGYDEEYAYTIEKSQDEHLSKLGYYPPLLVIFDDCISKESKKSKPLMDLFVKGRHRNISVIFISQDPAYCHNSWRSNCDYMFWFRCPGRIKFIMEWVGTDISKNEVNETHKNDYWFIVIRFSGAKYLKCKI